MNNLNQAKSEGKKRKLPKADGPANKGFKLQGQLFGSPPQFQPCFSFGINQENGLNLATFSGTQEIPPGKVAKVVYQEAGVHPPRVTEFDFQRVRQTLPTVMALQEVVRSLLEILTSLSGDMNSLDYSHWGGPPNPCIKYEKMCAKLDEIKLLRKKHDVDGWLKTFYRMKLLVERKKKLPLEKPSPRVPQIIQNFGMTPQNDDNANSPWCNQDNGKVPAYQCGLF